MSMHTVSTQDLIEISLQSNENIDILIDLIKYEANTDKNLKCHVFPILCELMWLNSSILLLLKRGAEDLEFKDNTQKEVVLAKVTIDTLSTLMLARYQATNELNNFSYSVSLH
tara:strand:+ start:539 stop:877 length:339 start_codon:yes stop_codon:yes gene_type:complete